MEHLRELRKRFVRWMLALVIGGVVSFFFYPQFLHFLQAPYCSATHQRCVFLVTNPLDGLSLRFKISLYGGILLSLPLALWQLWRFVTPGLKKHERVYALSFVSASLVFFAMGAAVAYITFPHALAFLQSIGGSSLHTEYNPNNYLTLFLLLILIFGATFEFPVILVGLQLANVVTPSSLLRWWRYAIIGITVVAGVITPSSDPFSMLAMMLPLIVFYFLAIGVGRLLGKK
jgi:sec-independent protein translocase protein TatC